MSVSVPRWVVCGAGSIGGLWGFALAKNAHVDVVLLGRSLVPRTLLSSIVTSNSTSTSIVISTSTSIY